MTKVTHCNCSE